MNDKKQTVLVILLTAAVICLSIALLFPRAQEGESELEDLFGKTVGLTGNEYRQARKLLLSTHPTGELEAFLGAKWATSKSWQERTVALILLSRLRVPDMFEAVEASAKGSVRHWKRGAGISTIGNYSLEESETRCHLFAALCELLLKSTETGIRGAASETCSDMSISLGRLEPSILREPLWHLCATESEPEIRANLVQFLVWYKDKNSHRVLQTLLTSDPSPKVRFSVAANLHSRFSLPLESLFNTFSQETDEEVKAQIARAIAVQGNIGEDKAFEVALSDKSAKVREGALSGIAQRAEDCRGLNTDKDLARVVEIIKTEKENEVIWRAFRVLAEVPGENARKTLFDLLGSSNPDIRRHAATTLFERKEGGALPTLLKMLAEGKEISVFDFVEHYGAKGIDAVESGLGSMPLERRIAIVREMGKISWRTEYMDTLRRLSENDPDPSLRQAARASLNRLDRREQ